MEHTWVYNGCEYPFDISDSEHMGRMCRGLDALRSEIGTLDGKDAPEESLKEQCGIIRHFFDIVFGEGVGADICGEAYSADAHTTAYMEFILFVNTQVTAFREKMEAVEAKYCARAEQAEQAEMTEQDAAYGA